MKWASLPAWIATAYSLLVIVAAVIWHRRRTFRNRELPAVSVLKPLCGDSSYIYRALRSHVLQDYPDFEILFGASSARDPVLAEVERLQREFPSHKLRIVLSHSDALNPKVGLLEALAAAATHDLLVIQDDDVVASPGLLRSIVAPFRDPRTGLVTCLYRSHGRSFASRLEALGIVTEFIPRVVVARVLGVREFALGATIAIRKSVLAEIGGFQAVAPYLADDYHLGRLVAERGYRVEFASCIVETAGGASTWLHVWSHQVRWARTIRISRPAGYYASIITNATLWGCLAICTGAFQIGIAALVFRLVAAAAAGALVLRDSTAIRWFWLIPVRDLLGFLVWCAGCAGTRVEWRGKEIRVGGDGRIEV